MLQGVGPLEHLGAALAILGVEGWVLEADHEDLPLFDGSSLAWAEAIRATGPTLSPSMVACPKTREWSDARGWIRVQPAQSFHLKVVWTKGELGEEVWEGDESNLVDLLAARTFVKTHEFVQARAAGLLLGVTPESGRLLRGSLEHHQEQSLVAELGVSVGDRAWTGGDPRLNGECAAHKALDILGDLYWSMGGLPLASIEAMDTGHALHWRVGQDLADRTVAP